MSVLIAPSKQRIQTIGLILIGITIGVGIASQLRLHVVPRRVNPLVPSLALTQTADLLSATVAAERASIDDLQHQLVAAQAAAAKSQPDKSFLAEVAAEREQLGLTARSGRGVTMTLADATLAVGTFGIIEAADLRDLVNVLWRHQVSGISINGERIVPTTAIGAVADLTLINGAKTTQPYTVDVLGASEAINQALTIDPLLRSFRTKVALEGVRFGRRVTELTLPAYRGSFLVEQARPE